MNLTRPLLKIMNDLIPDWKKRLEDAFLPKVTYSFDPDWNAIKPTPPTSWRSTTKPLVTTPSPSAKASPYSIPTPLKLTGNLTEFEDRNHLVHVKSHLQTVFETFRSVCSPYWEYNGIDSADIYLSGGAIASLVHGEKPADYDLYLGSPRTRTLIMDFFNKHPDLIDEYTGNYRNTPISLTPQQLNGTAWSDLAITLDPNRFDGLKFQVVLCYEGQPETIIRKFDMLHCQSYFSRSALYVRPSVYKCVVNKEIRHAFGNEIPINMDRMTKMLNRGWKVVND
jgi:hypothetical protein